MDDFETFWKHYPRKVKKGDARKAWMQTAAIRPSLEDVLKAIQAACRSPQWQKDCGQFIPYPASWLRGECWDDDHTISLTPKLPNVTGAASQEIAKPTPQGLEASKKVLELLRRTA